MKRVLPSLLTLLLLFTSITHAQNPDTATELGVKPGITPDSNFYFIESTILEKFRSDLVNREKKIAEIEAMVQEGNINAARTALNRYQDYAQHTEENLAPEQSAEAKRSAAAIQNSIEKIKTKIPEQDRPAFVDRIQEKEKDIATAAELSTTIKTLCEKLSQLDPKKYTEVCKTDNDAPAWQKKLDKKLTAEQEKEAEAFFTTMSQCFNDPKACQCDTITVKAFADLCKIKAPLAIQCQEGNKQACEQLDTGEDLRDLLPPHLESVFSRFERRYSNAENELTYTHNLPEACEQAQATTPQACRAFMFKTNAPEECVQAGLLGEPGDEKKCQELMFQKHAPEECVAAGVHDSQACGKLSFQKKAPQACLDAGLTGESREDSKKCQEIMREKGNQEGFQGQEDFGDDRPFAKTRKSGARQPPAALRACRDLQDKDAKLRCFEAALEATQQEEFQERDHAFERSEDSEQQQRHMNFPEPCIKAGATTPEACRNVMQFSNAQQRAGAEERRANEQQYADGQPYAQPFTEGLLPDQPPPSDETSYPRSPENSVPLPSGETLQQPEIITQETSSQTSPPPTTDAQPPTTGSAILNFADNSFLEYYYKN